MSEYPKIETLYERDRLTHKVIPGELKNRTYSLIKTWHWTEKINGMNIRCTWDHVSSRVVFGGKSDAAQIHPELLSYLYDSLPIEILKEVFPDKNAVIYGEGYGAGIQKGNYIDNSPKGIIDL